MDITKAWQDYEQGVHYKTRIGLYDTVALNERMFTGNQWEGIDHEGLPTPILNFIKRGAEWKIAAVTDRRVKMLLTPMGEGNEGDTGIITNQLSEYIQILWEQLKMDYLTKEGLKDACITGDYIQYFYWDDTKHTGQYTEKQKTVEDKPVFDEMGEPVMVKDVELMGEISTQLVDNVNYYPGNVNEPDPQKQPYIILVFREHIDDIKAELKRNKIRLDLSGDSETDYQSGDMAKYELDDESKKNVLLKMWHKDGTIWCEKSVREGVVRKEWDTKLTRYPIAMMNWYLRKNSCHGVAEVTGLVPNQVFVNKTLAFAQLLQLTQGFPKVIYNKNYIKRWSNAVGKAIAVNGETRDVAQVLNSATNNFESTKLLESTMQTTMEMMGANDITLGNISNPDNTSAFIATRDAAVVPLAPIQDRFYCMIEDMGLIFLDMMRAHYTKRKIPVNVTDETGERTVYVPMPDIKDLALRIKIDVGPSSMWSELQMTQTLDNLLAGGKITMAEYLDRLQPKGLIAKSDELKANYKKLDELQKAAQEAQYQMQIMQAQMQAAQMQMAQMQGAPPQ